jgi:hypothetical protein
MTSCGTLIVYVGTRWHVKTGWRFRSAKARAFAEQKPTMAPFFAIGGGGYPARRWRRDSAAAGERLQ